VTFSLYRSTRSARVTVQVPGAELPIVVENMRYDQGFSLSFEARRTMSADPGEYSVTMYNLPPDVLGPLEHAQVKRIDDQDALLVGQILRTAGVAADGADALEAGWLIVQVEAGYDEVVTNVFRAIGAKVRSRRVDDGLTTATTITAAENLDGLLLGLVESTFPPGAGVYDVVDYLRRCAGLGPGNLTPASLAGIIGDARIDSVYSVSGGDALGRLKSVLEWLPVRWFVDDRELWICGRDDVPNAYGFPAYVPDGIEEPDLILTRPERVDGGRVQVECLLCPRLRVGRLVRLTEAGLSLALQGLSPTEVQIALAEVPPGLYRLDEVSHRGATSGEEWTSTLLLRPGVAADE
jgi:hypothetical protein